MEKRNKSELFPRIPQECVPKPEFTYSETGVDKDGNVIYGVHEGRYILWLYKDGSVFTYENNPCPDHFCNEGDKRIWDGYDNSDGTICWFESV